MGKLNETTVRWGVWGAGRISVDVCRDLALVPNARLQAVAARRPEQASALASTQESVRSCDSLSALLEDRELDVVYIATPNECHAGDALACIDAGKAVLCEKPMALNAAQALEVAGAARARRVFCMEGLWSRFIPAIVEAREVVQSGRLGRIRTLLGSFGYRVSETPQSRVFHLRSGGGALLDRGVYLLSLAQYFLGNPQSVHGAWVPSAGGVDVQSSYMLGYADGAQACLTASLSTQLPNELVICGEAGVLTLQNPFYRASRYALQEVRTFDLLAAAPAQAGFGARVKNHPRVQRWRREALFWKGALRHSRATRRPFNGGGYQFELAEATRCVREGLLETPIMPLNDSIEVARQMDELRRQWGMDLEANA